MLIKNQNKESKDFTSKIKKTMRTFHAVHRTSTAVQNICVFYQRCLDTFVVSLELGRNRLKVRREEKEGKEKNRTKRSLSAGKKKKTQKTERPLTCK